MSLSFLPFLPFLSPCSETAAGSYLSRPTSPFPIVAVLGARRRVLSLENQREKQRAAPGRASGAGGAEWRELGLPRGGREGGRPAAPADAAAAVAAAAGAATAAAATCPPPPAAAL
uniref:Uncharacterized protein n=1 Tax=Chlorocebus sabaeus TaxID=60711 RepID=A0A0D9S649_CHLSB